MSEQETKAADTAEIKHADTTVENPAAGEAAKVSDVVEKAAETHGTAETKDGEAKSE